jgi:putative tryptophan/tyrosine transport system substrate-binding protein
MQFDQLGRRQFIAFLGSAAAACPLAAFAQQQPTPAIGYLSARTPEDSVEVLADFRRGLAETGFVEGQNVAIEYRWLEGRYDRLQEMVADLVRRRVAVIAIPNTTGLALAAKGATQTIPIVFNIGSDPVAMGLVATLSHPGKNVTGVAMLQTAVTAKRLELLHELVPTASSIAILVNPGNPGFAEADTKEAQQAARALGIDLLVLKASNSNEIDATFAALVERQAGALLISGDVFYISRTDQLVALAARHAVPTIYAYLEQGAAGALMCYGAGLAATQRTVGVYTGRILKGEKPADLPVEQVTKLQLVINMKTAKALGLTVPLSLLGRADEVIE